MFVLFYLYNDALESIAVSQDKQKLEAKKAELIKKSKEANLLYEKYCADKYAAIREFAIRNREALKIITIFEDDNIEELKDRQIDDMLKDSDYFVEPWPLSRYFEETKLTEPYPKINCPEMESLYESDGFFIEETEEL